MRHGARKAVQLAEYAGYRTQKHRQKKSKKKTLWKVLVIVAILIAAFVVLGAVVKIYPFDKGWESTKDGLSWMGRHIKSAWPFHSSKPAVAADFLPEGKTAGNYLLSVTKEIDGATYQSTVVLASYDATTRSGSLIYFPNDLLVNTPGMGTDLISNLVDTDQGRISSTLVTVENMLGTSVDRYVLGSDRDLRMILKQLGDKYDVDVDSKTQYNDPSLGLKVDLKPGRQSVDPGTCASYMTYGPSGKEVELAKRQAAWAPEFLAKVGKVDVKKFVQKNANLFDTDASNEELAGMLGAFAGMKGKMRTAVVPVKEFKFEKTIVHRLDTEALPRFVKTYLKGPSSVSSAARVKIEVLNGCGVPGIGEKASARIDLSKYQIVNSANADNFEHPETLIIMYGDSRELAASADELRNELEVGKLQQAPRTQNLSDISVIVGKDFASK